MSSPVKLISIRQISETSPENEYIWMYQINDRWTPFSDTISSTVERAFRFGCEEIFIDGIYRIDLKYFIQEHINDQNCKYLIRRKRRCLKSSVLSEEVNKNESRCCERFSFPLELVTSCSACVDTNYYGSPFIAEWFLIFTEGKRSVTFNSIFPVLIKGLQEEGQNEPEPVVRCIVDNLNKKREEILRKNEKTKMEELENYCAELYTKPYFIYRIVNIALRDNDYTKIRTLGPFCFLIFNYIGRHHNDNFSIRLRFQNILRPTKSQLMTVFRGDYISPELIEEYQQAVKNGSKYFKWLSFVSTSRDRDIAEDFAQNVLYIIGLQRYSLDDQFADLSMISSYKHEKEIVLQPGVRFQVAKVEFNDIKRLHLVYINIVPSYISMLR